MIFNLTLSWLNSFGTEFIKAMTTITQVSFTADQGLKNRALEKAKSEGITLKAFLTYAMKGFVVGRISLGIERWKGFG